MLHSELFLIVLLIIKTQPYLTCTVDGLSENALCKRVLTSWTFLRDASC